MSNPHEGQVSFDAAGKKWTLELTNRAERALQKKLKRPIRKILTDLEAGDVDDILALFVEGLQKHQPGTTEEAAIDLVRPRELRQLVTDMITATYVGEDDSADPSKPDQTPETGPAN